MSGIIIIGGLLRADAAITAFLADREQPLVVADQITGGRFPDGVTLPAMLVRTESVVERQPLKFGSLVRTVERVSVAVRAGSYRDQRAAIRLIRSACRGKFGAISDCLNVSVFTAGTGPDLGGPNDTYEQTTDFRVSFDAPA